MNATTAETHDTLPTNGPLEGNTRLTPGLLFVLAIPVAAGISSMAQFKIGGFNYTGWIGLAVFGAAVLVVMFDALVPRTPQAAFPTLAWLPWVSLVWISMTWRDSFSFTGVQQAILITAPIFVGTAASAIVRTEAQLRLLVRSFAATLVLLIFSAVLGRAGLLPQIAGETPDRALSITAALVGCVFLASTPQRMVYGMGGWLACLAIPLVTGSRTAAVAIAAPLLLHPRYPLRWRVFALAAVVVAGLGALQLPQVQARFFHSGQGTLDDVMEGRFDSSGRFDAWPVIYQRAWERPIFGAGVGSCTETTAEVWPGMLHPHNDYLRVGYDVGLVGLAVFLATFAWQMLDVRRRLTADDVTGRAFLAVWLGLCVLLVMAMTDNVLVYTVWYTHPLFALLGAAYGVVRRRAEAGI
jgi:O-antigen ligase